MKRKNLNFWITIILAIILTILTGYRISRGVMEQDSYLEYAKSLANFQLNRLDYSTTRLFPGLPLVLAMLYWLIKDWTILTIGLLVGCWTICNKLLNRLKINGVEKIMFFFPPIILDQVTQISSELLLIPIILAIVLAFKKRYWLCTGLLLGFAFGVRAVSVGFMVGFVSYLWSRKQIKEIFKIIFGWIVIMSGWLIYNVNLLGKSIWWQFGVYSDIGRSKSALLQILMDLLRAWDWGWYRSIVSGLFYLGILLGELYFIQKRYKQTGFKANRWLCLGGLMMCAFVFSFGPTPFLEEFARFLIPIFVVFNLYLRPFKKLPLWIAVILLTFSVGVIIF